MLYQEYKEKLYKRRRVYDGIYKFRFLIIAVALMLLAASGALMGVTGSVRDFSIPAAVVYGEEYTASAQCTFGEASFEYRAEGGSEWSQEAPKYAGRYECRPVSKSVFGTKRVGRASSFEILPAEVDVKVYGSQLRVGDDLTFYADMLMGDRLEVSSYAVTHEDGNFVVTFKSEDVHAISSDGKDVTSSYVFLPISKTLAVEKREITVTMPTLLATYDGQPHEYKEVTVEGLLPQHSVQVSASAFTDAGTHLNAASECKVLDENGEDITDIYAVRLVPGQVNILPREITVGAAPKEIIYDGEAHTYDKYELYDGTTLADGQSLRLSSLRSESEVGSYDNTAKISVLDAEENDVTKNYKISRRFEKMVISPRPIDAFTRDVTEEYSGEEYTFDSVETSGGLVAGHSVKVTSPKRYLSAGVHPNDPSFVIVDEGGRDVTKNYAVGFTAGSVTINKFKIQVVTSSFTAFYDGAPKVPVTLESVIPGYEGLLKDSDSFEFSYAVTMSAANEQGYENSPHIRILNDKGEDATDNYDVEFVYGVIKVLRRTLFIATFNAEFAYNGRAQFLEGYDLLSSDEEGSRLAAGQSVVVTSHTTVKDHSDSGAENVLTFAVRAGREDVSENYKFEVSYGILNVARKPVAVTTKSGEREYDGTPYFLHEIKLSGLIKGHSYKFVRIEDRNTQTAVGSAENVFDFEIAIFDGESDVTDNYTVDYDGVTYGTLEVTARKVKISTGSSGEIVYDALEHSEETLIADRLASGHVARTTFPRFVEVGEYVNEPASDIVIEDENGEDVTANYAITTSYGSISVVKRPLRVLTGSIGVDESVVYDGLQHGAHFYALDEASYALVEGHTLQLAYKSFADAGEHKNAVDEYEVLSDGGSVTKNYDVVITPGTVKISKRNIKVVTGSLDGVIYDGEGHVADSFEFETSEQMLEIVDGQEARAVFNAFYAVGEFDNIPTSFAVYAEEADVTKNYEINWAYGKVKIDRRKISVIAKSERFTYDALSHTYDLDSLDISGEPAHGQEFFVKNAPSFMYAGVHENAPEVAVRYKDSHLGVDMNNYEMTVEKGEIIVDRRAVDVTAASFEVFYDGYDKTPVSAEDALENALSLLQGGDRFAVSYAASVNMIDANEDGYENSPAIDVVDAAGKSVLDSYEINLTSGVIRVKKRDIYVTLQDICLEYNGKAQGECEITSYTTTIYDIGDGISFTDKLRIFNLAARKDHGFEELEIEYSILRGGVDASQNYNMFLTNANLIITPRDITLKTGDAEKLYDGEPLICGEVSAFGLVAGHVAEYTPREELPHLTMAGEADNAYAFDVTVRDENGEVVTENYNVSGVSYGTLKVKERGIVLTIEDAEFVYDAQLHGYTLSDVAISGDGLPEDGSERLSMHFAQHVDKGVYSDEFPFEIMHGEEVVTDNYFIETHFGTLTILAREVTLSTLSREVVYDAEEHTFEGYAEAEGSLVPGHRIVTSDGAPLYSSFEAAGEYGNTVASSWTITDGEKDVTDNYLVSWNIGIVKILKRQVTVEICSIGYDEEIVFDAVTHRDDSFTVTSELGFEEIGHELSIQTFGRYNAGEGDNALQNANSYSIKESATGKAVDKNNYEITWVNGKIKIKPCPVVVSLSPSANWRWTYDGSCHVTEQDVTLLGAPAARSYLVTIANVGAVTEAGEYKAGEGVFSYELVIKSQFGSVETSNFEITDEVAGSPLIIDKRPIKVKSSSGVWVFEEDRSFSLGEVESVEAESGARGILPAHSFTVLKSSAVSKITDALSADGKSYAEIGFEKNEILEYSILEGGVDRTQNYTIEWEYGTLRVKSPVQVYVYSLLKSYDGEEVTLAGEDNYKLKILPPDVSASDVSITLVGSLLKPGVVTLDEVTENSRKLSFVNADGPNRIDFVGQKNVIEITRRKLTVKTDTVVCVRGEEAIYGRDFGYTISGMLIGKDSLSFTIDSVLSPDVESVVNSVDLESVTVTDEFGRDVSDCYEVTFVLGTLSWES